MSQDALHQFALDLQALRDGQLSPENFSQACRQEPDLLPGLPDIFGVVLLGLLDRLESSASFAEESCSFSQHDLFDSLQLWLDKALSQQGQR